MARNRGVDLHVKRKQRCVWTFEGLLVNPVLVVPLQGQDGLPIPGCWHKVSVSNIIALLLLVTCLLQESRRKPVTLSHSHYCSLILICNRDIL